MCSTCDFKTYEKVDGKLQQNLGMGSLLIRCDNDGKKYKLAVKDEDKSEFYLYSCPTCGRKLS